MLPQCLLHIQKRTRVKVHKEQNWKGFKSEIICGYESHELDAAEGQMSHADMAELEKVSEEASENALWKNSLCTTWHLFC